VYDFVDGGVYKINTPLFGKVLGALINGRVQLRHRHDNVHVAESALDTPMPYVG
jgi:hypothetical protein